MTYSGNFIEQLHIKMELAGKLIRRRLYITYKIIFGNNVCQNIYIFILNWKKLENYS